MKSSTIFAASALLTSAYAVTVTLETTKCAKPKGAPRPFEWFEITIGAQPVPVNMPAVCGLGIVMASDPSIDIRTVQCQAFKDVAGTRPGSAVFDFDNPVLISKSPVRERSIKCSIVPAAAARARRQDDPNASISTSTSTSTSSEVLSSTSSIGISDSSTPSPSSPSSSSSTTDRIPRSTTLSTASANETSTSVSPSTIVRTLSATEASGLPKSSGNGTAPSNTGTPSSTPSATGAAASMGVGLGVVVAAFAVLVL